MKGELVLGHPKNLQPGLTLGATASVSKVAIKDVFPLARIAEFHWESFLRSSRAHPGSALLFKLFRMNLRRMLDEPFRLEEEWFGPLLCRV